MGIDYYVCDVCGETFPDCGEYYTCECGRLYCSEECATSDEVEDYPDDVDGDYNFESCKYCRGEAFTDIDILNYMLKKHKTNREKIIKEMKK